MKLWVDPAKCFGHGLCVEETPELFEWDDALHQARATGDVPPGYEAKARAAVRCCPEQAIVLTE